MSQGPPVGPLVVVGTPVQVLEPPAPGVPPDGDHNQGGIRKEGLDYQRDLGSEQDA